MRLRNKSKKEMDSSDSDSDVGDRSRAKKKLATNEYPEKRALKSYSPRPPRDSSREKEGEKDLERDTIKKDDIQRTNRDRDANDELKKSKSSLLNWILIFNHYFYYILKLSET